MRRISKTFFYNDNAPEYRRKQLDRGLFIASPDYSKDWFGYFRSLKQRNSALKLGDIAQAKAYDPLLVDHGERLNLFRENLITEVKEIYDEIEQIAAGVALGTGTEITVEFDVGGFFPVTYNEPSLVESMKASLESASPGKFIESDIPITGAEDFSYFLPTLSSNKDNH